MGRINVTSRIFEEGSALQQSSTLLFFVVQKNVHRVLHSLRCYYVLRCCFSSAQNIYKLCASSKRVRHGFTKRVRIEIQSLVWPNLIEAIPSRPFGYDQV
jgi:hypothetical protein